MREPETFTYSKPHPVEAELTGVIAGAAAEGVFPGEARDVDDEAAAAFAEPRQRFARAIEWAVQVELDVAAPLIESQVRDFAEHALTRVVHQNIQAAELAVHGREKSAHLVGLDRKSVV